MCESAFRESALYQYLEPNICIQQTKKMKRKKMMRRRNRQMRWNRRKRTGRWKRKAPFCKEPQV